MITLSRHVHFSDLQALLIFTDGLKVYIRDNLFTVVYPDDKTESGKYDDLHQWLTSRDYDISIEGKGSNLTRKEFDAWKNLFEIRDDWTFEDSERYNP